MLAVPRRFSHVADLVEIGDLVRRAWADEPGFNAWTFARFDIWSRWRLVDQALAGRRGWQDDVAVWQERERVVAAAFVGEAPNDGVLLLEPGARALAPDLLAWLEDRCDGAEPLVVEVNESNEELTAVVADRGYELLDGHYVPRRKLLGGERQPPRVPAGYRVATLQADDAERYLAASLAVFGHGATVEAYRYLDGARSAAPGVGVIAVDREGQVAAFANAWVDRRLGVAELDPVGTRPEHRRRGLAAAVTTEVENRLRLIGVPLATVHSWSTSADANGLYDRLGYEPVDRQRVWRRPAD